MTIRRTLCVTLRDPRPISVNRMYRNGRNGQRVLTGEGKHFKDVLRKTVARAAMESQYLWTETQDLVYMSGHHTRLQIDLYLKSVRNKSWKQGGGKTATGKQQSPYIRIDGTNYIKIIEDAVAEGTGIDDSCNLSVCVRKFESLDDPRVEVLFEVLPYEP